MSVRPVQRLGALHPGSYCVQSFFKSVSSFFDYGRLTDRSPYTGLNRKPSGSRATLSKPGAFLNKAVAALIVSVWTWAEGAV